MTDPTYDAGHLEPERLAAEARREFEALAASQKSFAAWRRWRFWDRVAQRQRDGVHEVSVLARDRREAAGDIRICVCGLRVLPDDDGPFGDRPGHRDRSDQPPSPELVR